MQKLILLSLFCCFIFFTQGQTKIIAHKSHSGNAANFNTAFENNFFDLDDDNLGQSAFTNQFQTIKAFTPPPSNLDSVIFLSDTSAIMVTSLRCINMIKYDTTLWKPGRATVYHHPLFSKQHSLDSIKNVIETTYSFNNSVNSVVFVGYDNSKEGYRKLLIISFSAIALLAIGILVVNFYTIKK